MNSAIKVLFTEVNKPWSNTNTGLETYYVIWPRCESSRKEGVNYDYSDIVIMVDWAQ